MQIILKHYLFYFSNMIYQNETIEYYLRTIQKFDNFLQENGQKVIVAGKGNR